MFVNEEMVRKPKMLTYVYLCTYSACVLVFVCVYMCLFISICMSHVYQNHYTCKYMYMCTHIIAIYVHVHVNTMNTHTIIL